MFNKLICFFVVSVLSLSFAFAQEDGALPDEMSQHRQLSRVDPDYPKEAEARNLSGWVLVGYDIDRVGRTSSVIALSSSDKIFEYNAISAVRRYTFSPAIRSGEPVEVRGQTVRINFKLAKR
ncbi:MAG: energy transducer TonB [Kordiimonadaceae bacterium]|jgi:TonB family protein|nr:energy transducer TonB [Kordiimonadaceae bacterium]MBT6031444.1 energy transducer TonB [Kordiimonadaceae bacterium]